uniref:Uncharacterized protein n=1 Tax=Anguilla anguilla TaxID=7936 RepID=A0A0E9RZN8_ANGAN
MTCQRGSRFEFWQLDRIYVNSTTENEPPAWTGHSQKGIVCGEERASICVCCQDLFSPEWTGEPVVLAKAL